MPLRRCRFAALPLALVLLMALWPLPAAARPPVQTQSAGPTSVTIPGTIQSVLGCPGDWQPACTNTYLTYDQATDLWSARFDLPAGDYEYKAALNDSWAENYGLNATPNGANIPLSLSAPASVLFFYDHKTHWVSDSINTPLFVVAGDFQQALGCPTNDDPACLGGLMQDPEGDGSFTWITTKLPAGSYSARITVGGTRDNAIGADGLPGGPPIAFTVANDSDEIYFGYNVDTKQLTVSTAGAPRGDLSKARAHWLTRDLIAWNVIGSPKYRYALYADPEGAITTQPSGVSGGRELPLTFSSAGPGDLLKRFPHLAGFSAFTLAAADQAQVAEALRGQVVVAAYDDEGKLFDATRVQTAGVLDELFVYDGALGVSWEQDPSVSTTAANPTLRLWAPTARNVTVQIFPDSSASLPSEVRPLSFDQTSGVWQIGGDPSWKNRYYRYEVEIYVPTEGKVVKNLVTDPYSFSLSANSTRSQIVDLSEPTLAPEGWQALAKPPLEAPEDAVLYELHVRDFSIFDQTVPADLRGTFRAFTVADSAGMNHLRELAAAGISHVHLLPAFDIATIEERRDQQTPLPLDQLAALPPDSTQQQALLAPIRDKDGFNWGYDPLHYTVPEGSYSTNPEGSLRVLEFREMVAALNTSGLRVVMDVVYNHTNANGQAEKSVLDKIVPGYYHRLDGDGVVTNSTCCSNTASEHRMMEKLMVDSLVTWAKAYKVDGFRFDLMGHHMKANMVAVREALDALTSERDGVDGKAIILYGEGWDFGEVANNGRGENATQLNMAGSGIGTFSDRLRDAARGGGPFDGLQEQGFISGLFDNPNEVESRSPDDQRARLLSDTDLIKLGLAGNLKGYLLPSADGRELRGEQIRYRGAPAGYTLDPQEQVVYVSAHDNETLFDAVQLKAPRSASVQERARMAMLGLSLVAFAQGVPFFHAGDELLRSKSLDRNSYNSSDWFNRIDWTGQQNTFGAGLPPSGDNEANWEIMAALLADPALRPDAATMAMVYKHFREVLTIRKSTPLFRLRTAEQVQSMLRFFNNGPEQTPGLLVMSISDNGPTRLDTQIGQVVVLINATTKQLTFGDAAFKGATLELHPVLQQSEDERIQMWAGFDPGAGNFVIPARSTVVFVGADPVLLADTAAQPATTATAPATTPQPMATVPASDPAVAPAPQPTAVPTPQSAQGSRSPVVWLSVITVLVAVCAALFLRRQRGRG